MKIAVTGCSGFIGSHLIQRLLNDGYDVFGVDKEGGGDYEFYKMDIAHNIVEADVVFHLAAQTGLTASLEDYVNNNIYASSNIRGDRVINISTSSVYGAYADGDETSATLPISHYGITKLAAERLTGDVTLRLFSVYGPGDREDKLFPRLIKAIEEGKEFTFTGSGHERSFTYVDDVVDAMMMFLHEGTGIYNVGAESFPVIEAIQIIEGLLGKKAILKAGVRKGDQIRTCANTEKIRSLGWMPKVNLKEGLQCQLEKSYMSLNQVS